MLGCNEVRTRFPVVVLSELCLSGDRKTGTDVEMEKGKGKERK